MTNQTRRFKELPLGTRFRFKDGRQQVWVKLNDYENGLIVEWNGSEAPRRQSMCSFGNSEEERDTVEVVVAEEVEDIEALRKVIADLNNKILHLEDGLTKLPYTDKQEYLLWLHSKELKKARECIEQQAAVIESLRDFAKTMEAIKDDRQVLFELIETNLIFQKLQKTGLIDENGNPTKLLTGE